MERLIVEALHDIVLELKGIKHELEKSNILKKVILEDANKPGAGTPSFVDLTIDGKVISQVVQKAIHGIFE